MNIADRIQNLRKMKGISQEELAGRMGVSRQAVSKWESEQSLPDLEKIVLMSEYFDVTTDYILKGIETTEQSEKKTDANIFVIVATVLDFIGLIITCAVWYERQVATAIVIGLVFMALGCMVYGIGMLDSAKNTKAKGAFCFWVINIWMLVFIPLSVIYNLLVVGLVAPYPMIVHPLIAYLVFWMTYIAICLGVTLVMRKRRMKFRN